MLRRTFVELVGAVAAMLGLPAAARAAEQPECPGCAGRDAAVRPGHISRARTEDDLRGEYRCWVAGHLDAHDRAVQDARRRILARARQDGDPRAPRLLGRREKAA